jgi:HAMP domain-containing protein
MIVFSYVSYIGVKNAALKAGRERLQSLSDQLGSVFSQSANVFINATRVTAQNDSIISCLKTLDSSSCNASFKLLETMRQDTMSVLIDILDEKHRRIVRSSKKQIENNVNFDSLFAISVTSDTGKFGRIFQIRDSAYYSIAIPIKDKQRLLGYLVRWRIITANPRSIEQFSRLIGTNAQLYVGNADGSLWTNMIRPIPNPIPGNYKSADNLMEYSRGKGNYYFAAQRQINNTQWSILVEFSQKTILETANRFLAWIIVIGAILVLIGIFFAWIMSRNITRPLNKLTEAASVIASGNSASSVAVERKDDLGKLARAFNAMTVQVDIAKQNLEQKIIEAGKMNEQLRELSAHLQNIREQERIHNSQGNA